MSFPVAHFNVEVENMDDGSVLGHPFSNLSNAEAFFDSCCRRMNSIVSYKSVKLLNAQTGGVMRLQTLS